MEKINPPLIGVIPGLRPYALKRNVLVVLAYLLAFLLIAGHLTTAGIL